MRCSISEQLSVYPFRAPLIIYLILKINYANWLIHAYNKCDKNWERIWKRIKNEKN